MEVIRELCFLSQQDLAFAVDGVRLEKHFKAEYLLVHANPRLGLLIPLCMWELKVVVWGKKVVITDLKNMADYH